MNGAWISGLCAVLSAVNSSEKCPYYTPTCNLTLDRFGYSHRSWLLTIVESPHAIASIVRGSLSRTAS